MAYELMESSLKEIIDKMIAKADFLIKLNTPKVLKKDRQSCDDSDDILETPELIKALSSTHRSSIEKPVPGLQRDESEWKVSMNEWCDRLHTDDKGESIS